MENFKKYIRKQIAELRPVNEQELKCDAESLFELYHISISNADANNGSPKLGDMIARNPKNHDDQWLVAEQYFKDNFEELEQLNQRKDEM